MHGFGSFEIIAARHFPSLRSCSIIPLTEGPHLGKVITFAQQKGGSGKTTLLVHLAHSWLLSGRKVAVIDLDPQQSLTRWLAYGTLAELSMVESKDYRVASDIRQASREHDLVLVDCPGNASNLLEATIRASDLVLAPCQPTAMDVWATEAILKMAAQEKVNSAVVMNRVAARGSATSASIQSLKLVGATVLSTHLGNRVGFSAGFSRGQTAIHLAGNSTATREIEALKLEIEAMLQ